MREHGAGNETPPNCIFLGFDVAGETLFWSIVGDLPQDTKIDVIINMLNDHGLFDKAADAESYLREYRSKWLTDPDLELSVWEGFW